MITTKVEAADSFDRIREGLTEGLEFAVTAQDMDVFRTLSGDDNPLHLDEDFARARGFEGPVVYGGLMLAAISRLLGTKLPGYGCVWHSLRIDFKKPLYVDERATLTGAVTYCNASLGLLRVDLRIAAGDRVLAKGEAQASLARPTS
jgi:3-hydroxybutyryl-CoA dehydratase